MTSSSGFSRLAFPALMGLGLVFGSAQSGFAQSAAAERPDAMQSLMGLFQPQVAQAQPTQADRIESEALPPPGFATPNGGPPPLSGAPIGHQFGDQPSVQLPSAQMPSAPMATAPVPGSASAAPDGMRPPGGIGGPSSSPRPVDPTTVMALPEDDQPEQGQPKELAPNLKKQLVDFNTKEPAGTIVVDTANTYLFLVLGGGKALRYGVRVGRDGFTWTGTERVSRMKEWPDWFPPSEMIERQPYLPRFMAGGNGNPLGARALYLGKTLYRIHGTNQPSTIGKYVSSGCVGMLNEDIEDLYSRVQVGTRVVVLPGKAPDNIASGPQPPANPMAPPPPAGSLGTQAVPASMAPAAGQAGIASSSLPPAR